MNLLFSALFLNFFSAFAHKKNIAITLRKVTFLTHYAKINWRMENNLCEVKISDGNFSLSLAVFLRYDENKLFLSLYIYTTNTLQTQQQQEFFLLVNL